MDAPEIKMTEDRLPPANEFGQHFTDPEDATANHAWVTTALQAALAALMAIECVVSPAQARRIALQTRIGIAVSSGVLTEEGGLA